MIDRLLPAVAAATSRMPPSARRIYGDFSNRVLDSSTVYRQMRSSIAEMGSALIDFSQAPVGDEEERIHELAKAIRPWTTPGARLVRLGDGNDGAYVMLEPVVADAAISLGVGHDVSWDREVAARGIPVAMFDPTVSELPSPVPGGTFHRIGLGDPADFVGTDLAGLDLRPFADLVRLSDAASSDSVILKVDIEGAEWDALRRVDFSPFTQVLIEMHDLDRLRHDGGAGAVLDVLRHLASTHRSIHVHANNERPFHRFGRIWFPQVIEVSFARSDLLVDATPSQSLNAHLDVPSNPRYPEYDLTGLLTLRS